MLFAFHSLLDKVRQLAELAHALRGENAALRADLARLTAENTRLAQRMQEAHDRVARLMAALPAAGEETTDTVSQEAA